MAAGEESFVCIGTAFDIPDEDAPKKKALAVHEQYATDTEGRRRFHGAFTGGFSAGYFNTVGSKEGWTPSTFISSRQKRFESSRQKPEDFMDEEDLGEFGIAPRNVETTKLFSQKESKEKRNEPVVPKTGVSLDSMMRCAIHDLVVPCQMSIGIRLLKRMGWKEGQGIGPRVRQLPKKKVYGCVLPTGLTANEKGDNEHDIYAEGLLFAPKDTKTIKFTPKDNLHGIGYQGMLVPTQLQISKPGFSGSLKIKGQAFGVGAFEDDDEDVYSQDSISNYDVEIHDRKTLHSDLHGWTGPPAQAIKGGALSHFAKVSKPKPANKVFPPPSIPIGYQSFVDVKETYNIKQGKTSMAQFKTSEARGKLLGEQPLSKKTKSVFDLISKDDRERIASTKQTLQTNSSVMKNYFTQQCSNVRTDGFQPFSKDPAKQARYDSFLKSQKSGESNTSEELGCGLTEWEREREKDEFSKAAMLYQPLKGDIALRFTRGKNIDDDFSDKNQPISVADESVSVEEKAAGMKMFGKLTRKTFEWHPSKLLCKRFNISEPYPSSSKTGLVSEKKEKFTLGQLFETSQKDRNDPTPCLTETTNVSHNLKAEPDQKIILENFSADEKGNINSSPGAVASFEEKVSEKPSMDLFKAIFASSSEDESENSEDEQPDNEQSSHHELHSKKNLNANVDTVSKQQTKQSLESKDTFGDISVNKLVSQVSVGDSSDQLVKTLPEQNNEQNVMEVEEAEYGPRPPPLRSQEEESRVKLEFQSSQTVPFSRYDSNSESDSDRPKRKHRKKHKYKHKSKESKKEKSRKREKDKPRKNDRLVSPNFRQKSDTRNEQTDQLKHKEIPDDKQILSRLKAVQKRRMCAADFM